MQGQTYNQLEQRFWCAIEEWDLDRDHGSLTKWGRLPSMLYVLLYCYLENR